MKEAYSYLLKELGLKYGDSIVVGVSGGPDSMALLHLLIRLKQELNLKIICAHVNHNVRKESDAEKVFVEKYCANNNIIFEYIKLDKDKQNEEILRRKRYDFLEKILEKYNSKYLLTAHHADDLMETVLMRIVRGSTLKGYSGFSKVLKYDNYKIIRPLIGVTKDEIYNYLKDNKLKYVIDNSNFSDVHTRNRYRKYIIPVLKKEDKNVHKKFLKFSETLLLYSEYVDMEVKKVIKKVYPQNVLNLIEYNKLPYLIKMQVIYYILEDVYQNDLLLITDTHANMIYELINNNKNASLNLPNNIKALKDYDTLTLIKNEKVEGYELEFNDFQNLPNGMNIACVKKEDSDSNYICRLNKKDIKLPLYVRSRKIGDKISVKGMLGSKKVNDIFIDCKVSNKERELWPIVVDSNNTIVWLPGLKKSKLDKTKSEKYDIILKYY